MKKRAREEPFTPVQQIYNTEASKLIDRGLDLVTNIPRFHTVKHALYNQRHLDMPSLPVSRMEIALSGDYKVTEDGKNFLAFDTEEESRIIGFATDDNLRLLCSSNTVKPAPKMFYQLYTLHVDTSS